MVTWTVWKKASNTTLVDGTVKYIYYGEGECVSGDEKPTDGIYNGSKLFEMDTSTMYMFDQASGAWKKWGT